MESANIVGYTTVTVPQGKWYMAAVPFETVGGAAISLQNLVTGDFTTKNVSGLVGVWGATVPQIQIQNRGADGKISSGYTTYYYLGNGNTATSGVTAPGWANQGKGLIGDKAADVKVEPGVAYWFKDPDKTVVATFAGQVVDTSAKTVFVPAGKWQMVCNPFPMDIPLNSVNMETDIVGKNVTGLVGVWGSTVPQIQIQNRDSSGQISSGYTTYYYLGNGNTATTGVTAPGWTNQGKGLIGDKAASVSIPAGSGFWFKNPDADTTITFSK